MGGGFGVGIVEEVLDSYEDLMLKGSLERCIWMEGYGR